MKINAYRCDNCAIQFTGDLANDAKAGGASLSLIIGNSFDGVGHTNDFEYVDVCNSCLRLMFSDAISIMSDTEREVLAKKYKKLKRGI